MNDERGDGKRYNGWANYETWAVRLWLDNEQPSYRYWTEQARNRRGREYDRVRLAEQLEAKVKEAGPELGCTLYADLMSAAFEEVARSKSPRATSPRWPRSGPASRVCAMLRPCRTKTRRDEPQSSPRRVHSASKKSNDDSTTCPRP